MFRKVQLVSVLVLGVFLPVLVAGQCPVKECYCDMVSILCEFKGFTSLPAFNVTQQTNQTSLILDTNEITSIPARSLPANLTQLSLDENPILTVDDAAFDASANTLNTLSISKARFTRIPDAFLHLHALTQFTIYDTNITDWNTNAMKNIGKTLQTFYFTQAGLNTWPDCIQYFTHLTDLTVSFTSIEQIPDNTFSNLATSLKTLSLINNNLSTLPKSLSNLKALEMLYLSTNKIVDVSSLPLTAKLKTLTLDGNRISDGNLLSNLLRRYADSLVSFSLADNRLSAIPDLSFLKSATEFYFTNNQISDAYSGSLPSDTFNIDLQNNILTAIPSVFQNLTSVLSLLLSSNIIRAIREGDIPQWITQIQLDYNFITQLTDTSFPVNSSLTSLDLDYNPISDISASAFVNLHFLTGISIKGSKLTRVPLALTTLAPLNFIDLSDSKYLVCTCLEKSLGPWLKHFEEYTVDGNCGEISIYDFFVNLSPACPTS
ncbi:unnamed protein product [Candidula unifasciata]|uniref:Uncharacterized protein n=1 Tax=Candidula unifasciata TaxID=100452 RepID=A0A8S3Z947_9EUPU|nr:unnamed protein product [Candidula unifasciata]